MITHSLTSLFFHKRARFARTTQGVSESAPGTRSTITDLAICTLSIATDRALARALHLLACTTFSTKFQHKKKDTKFAHSSAFIISHQGSLRSQAQERRESALRTRITHGTRATPSVDLYENFKKISTNSHFYWKRASSPARNWCYSWKIENRGTYDGFVFFPEPQLHQIFKPIKKNSALFTFI